MGDIECTSRGSDAHRRELQLSERLRVQLALTGKIRLDLERDQARRLIRLLEEQESEVGLRSTPGRMQMAIAGMRFDSARRDAALEAFLPRLAASMLLFQGLAAALT